MSTSDMSKEQSQTDTASQQTQNPGSPMLTEQKSMQKSPGSVARRLIKKWNSSSIRPMAADNLMRVEKISKEPQALPMGYTGGSVATE